MRVHEFYAKYANTPLPERLVESMPLPHYGLVSLHQIYTEMQLLDEITRPAIIRQQELLSVANKYYYHKENESSI